MGMSQVKELSVNWHGSLGRLKVARDCWAGQAGRLWAQPELWGLRCRCRRWRGPGERCSLSAGRAGRGWDTSSRPVGSRGGDTSSRPLGARGGSRRHRGGPGAAPSSPGSPRAAPGMRAAGGAMACEWQPFPSLSRRPAGPARPGKAPRGAVPGAPRLPGVPGPGETGKGLGAGRRHSPCRERSCPGLGRAQSGLSARPAGLSSSRNTDRLSVLPSGALKQKKPSMFYNVVVQM